MSDRLRFTARILGYVGAVLLTVDIVWVAGAAHIKAISPSQYTAVTMLLSTLGGLCLFVAIVVRAARYIDRQAEQRELDRMAKVGEMHKTRAVHEERIEDTQALMADELVTIHSLGAAVNNATGSLPEVRRLLMAVREDLGETQKMLGSVATQTAETGRDLHLLRNALVEATPGLGEKLAADFARYLQQHGHDQPDR